MSSACAPPGVPTLSLEGAWPNPTQGEARIRFALQRPSRVRRDVEDISGRRVRVLVDGEFGAGPHESRWDGRDSSGSPAATGVYVCRAGDGASASQIKLTLVR